MELKPGYKQTEVGVIPEEWIIQPIANLVADTSPICHGVVQVGKHSDDGIPIIAIKHVKEIGRVTHQMASRATEAPYSRSRVQAGDVLISIKGTIGRVGIVPTGFRGNIGRELARLRIREGVCPEFVAFQLEGVSTQDRINQAVVGTTRLEFSIAQLRNLPIALPAVEAEQRAIAETLSDIDAKVRLFERLITKKKRLKQAAMQELLTGKRRLPGFEGEWEVKRLGSEISDLEAGVSVVSLQGKDQASTGRFVLKTSAVTSGQLIASESKEIAPTDLARAKTPIRKGDVIISRMNTPALVGECGYSESDYPNLYLPDRLWRVSYQNPAAVSSRWLAYSLSFDHNRTRIKELATGTSGSMKNISKHALLSMSIQWPSLAEQQAVAGYISLLDEEIKALTTKLEKTRALKQAMMQELLTGRIRLV